MLFKERVDRIIRHLRCLFGYFFKRAPKIGAYCYIQFPFPFHERCQCSPCVYYAELNHDDLDGAQHGELREALEESSDVINSGPSLVRQTRDAQLWFEGARQDLTNELVVVLEFQ